MVKDTSSLGRLMARSHVLGLLFCLILGAGLRFVGLTRGISDFDPAGRSDRQAFYHFHPDEETLIRAEQELGVPVEVILAIIGVETYYGKNKGIFRALDALATLGLDYPKRAKFFLGELESLFLLGKEENLKPAELKGSYAGAMGFGQFIPSSYLAYAVDFDHDGRRDLIDNPIDAIGSVANYLAEHGWDKTYGIAAPVGNAASLVERMESRIEVKETGQELSSKGVSGVPADWAGLPLDVLGLHGASGDEYWAVTKNFYVITRYNRSPLYCHGSDAIV